MLHEADTVVLRVDLPEHGLKSGDVGTVVLVHLSGGYEVEFMALDGETIAVILLADGQIRPIARREIAHARSIARHGAQVAQLVPVDGRLRRDPREAAIRIRELRRGIKLGRVTLRELVEKGRL
jgi:hypothetical protein